MPSAAYRSFYDERRDRTYGAEYTNTAATAHAHYPELKAFIEEYHLADARCLEIGSSGGMFQDMVEDYHGTDIAPSLARHYHKPYRVASDSRYPYDDGIFEAIWTFDVYEHIPHLQEAMLEMKRLLKPGGVVLFAPAWQCRSWAADGYAVRPYSDFGLRGRLIKSAIPLRDSIAWRSLRIMPKRLARHLMFCMGRSYGRIRYRKLQANYTDYWIADSDACNHIDPHDAILWFHSNGFECLSHPMHLQALMVRTGAIVCRKL